MIIKIIISGLAIIVTLYGVFKKNRVFFNIGYFVFGIMVVFDQINLFIGSSKSIHLALASLWLIQASLAIPNKLPYDGSKLAKSAGIKIYSALSIINLFGAYYATIGDEVPEGAMYGHLLFGILPLVAIYLILSDKIEISK